MHAIRSMVRIVALVLFGLMVLSDVGVAAPTKKPVSKPPSKPNESQDVLVDKERRRLEELFIWKMSEELKLPVEQETQFANLMRSLNREKAKANLAVSSALDEMTRAQALGDPSKARVAVEKAVKNYEKAWLTYGKIPLNEVRRMRQLLGSERLGKYLVAKSLMAEKLMALSVREASEINSPAATASPKP